jgi:hypothetical protein
VLPSSALFTIDPLPLKHFTVVPTIINENAKNVLFQVSNRDRASSLDSTAKKLCENLLSAHRNGSANGQQSPETGRRRKSLVEILSNIFFYLRH